MLSTARPPNALVSASAPVNSRSLLIISTEHGDYELALRWFYPDSNDMDFYMRAAYHDGTSCPFVTYLTYDNTGMCFF